MLKLKYLVLFSVTGTIISLDQLTKHLIVQRFRLGESVSIIPGFFNLTYVQNPGAAFGLLAKWDSVLRVPFFILLPILALSIIAFIFWKIPHKDIKISSALSLVIGGAIGNLIDRASYNHVIDFLDFYWKQGGPHYPTFNIADIVICIGVGLLILDLVINKQKETSSHVSRTH